MHIEGAFGSRHTTTNLESQLRSSCWFYEENRRTQRKTFEARKRPTTTTLLTRVPSFENQHEIIPSGHPSSYNPKWSPIQL